MAQLYSCELRKIFKNIFFTVHLRATASEFMHISAKFFLMVL